ncbi:CHAT domain-containing protein [Lusitaniella coriacea]|uniref:CHAT domain-containing protein n=1 Tax=Lusitaniella coriacea TaxID=1983105 RepID=UPI003CEE608D
MMTSRWGKFQQGLRRIDTFAKGDPPKSPLQIGLIRGIALISFVCVAGSSTVAMSQTLTTQKTTIEGREETSFSTLCLLRDDSCLVQSNFCPLPSASCLPEKHLKQIESQKTPFNSVFKGGMERYSEGTVAAWRDAIARWEEALAIARNERDREQEALTLYWLGLVHFNLKELKTSADYYTQVLSIYEENGDLHSQASILNTLAQIHATWGEYQKAFDTYDRALKLWQAAKFRTGEAATLNNIGFVYADLGDFNQALDYYQNAFDLVENLGNPINIAATLNNLGRVYSDSGKGDKALSTYNQALALWREAENVPGEASTLNNIGFIYANRNNWTKAQEYYNQALPLWQQVGDKAGEASTLTNLGVVAANQGNPQNALERYNQALTFRREVRDRAKEALTLYRIALAQRDLNNLDEAQRQIEAALKIIEDLRGNVARSDLRATFFASKQDYYEFYIDLLMERHKQQPQAGYDRLALQASERTRARTLLEVLREANADIRQGVNPELLAQEQQLQRQLSVMEEQRIKRLSGKSGSASAENLDLEIESAIEQYRQVRAKIRATSPRYAALTQPEPLNVQQIQQQVLDKDTMLLEYFVGEKRSYLWAVTDNTLVSYELPGRDEIQSLAKEYRRLLTSPAHRRRIKTVAAAQSKLSNAILKPVADRIRGKRLLIVSHDILQYVPFAALSVSGTTGEEETPPLIVEHEIVSLPSASTLAILRQEQNTRSRATKDLAIFADPVFGSNDDRLSKTEAFEQTLPAELEASARAAGVNLSRLPFTKVEADNISALVSQEQTRGAIGFEANRVLATSQELSQYRMIHFATHGLLNSQNPELSGLVLTLFDSQGQPQNGFLRMHELFNLTLPADLVVLSACETGLGERVRGEGLIGLTRGFMYAGAARVVVSLWNVDDRGTAELMAKFYQQMLQQGLSPSAALRQAQIEMWQTEEWKSPFYWAGFTLQGEWK